jgi:SAM-dependent methyltransferase
MTSAAESVRDFYQRHAEEWAADRGARLTEGAWLDRFMALMPPSPRVLDLGCGSGDPLARALIGRGCRMTGIDAAPAMIAMCSAKFPGHDWHVADMRDLALGRMFDGILTWDSFFHLSPDGQRAMFDVFAAHALPGAALMFTSGWSHGEVLGEIYGEAVYHASLAPAEFFELCASRGFDVVAHVVKDAGCDRTVWLARGARVSA